MFAWLIDVVPVGVWSRFGMVLVICAVAEEVRWHVLAVKA